jgi:hypothetical protein
VLVGPVVGPVVSGFVVTPVVEVSGLVVVMSIVVTTVVLTTLLELCADELLEEELWLADDDGSLELEGWLELDDEALVEGIDDSDFEALVLRLAEALDVLAPDELCADVLLAASAPPSAVGVALPDDDVALLPPLLLADEPPRGTLLPPVELADVVCPVVDVRGARPPSSENVADAPVAQPARACTPPRPSKQRRGRTFIGAPARHSYQATPSTSCHTKGLQADRTPRR